MWGYLFGPFQLDLVQRQLRREGELVPLTPKVFDLLCLLIERRGQAVEKEEIIHRIWPNTIVEESNISVNMSVLRRALGESRDHRYILTLSGKGYRFIAEAKEIGAQVPLNPPLPNQVTLQPGARAASAAEFAEAMLEPVSGASRLASPFYIPRDADAKLYSAIARRDSLVLIKGARQVGKTSLLARGLQQAREWEAKVLLTDFQDLNAAYLESIEKFFMTLAELIADQLSLSVPPQQVWKANLGPSVNFERYWRRVILAEIGSPIVWGLDEVDRLFACDFASEVFGLFRSWHNKRALDPAAPWSRLTLVMSYATEAYLFITDLNQSPFNVGTRLQLDDFTLEELRELNACYDSPLTREEELWDFYNLIGGHPFLANRGLWEMKTHHLSLSRLAKHSVQDDGVFSDHLRRILISVNQNPQSMEALRAILQDQPCPTTELFYRLRSAGLIKGESARTARIRNMLYKIFLLERI